MDVKNIRGIVDNLIDDRRRTSCDYQSQCQEYQNNVVPERTVITQHHPLAKCIVDLDKVERSGVCTKEFRTFISKAYYNLMNSNGE